MTFDFDLFSLLYIAWILFLMIVVIESYWRLLDHLIPGGRSARGPVRIGGLVGLVLWFLWFGFTGGFTTNNEAPALETRETPTLEYAPAPLAVTGETKTQADENRVPTESLTPQFHQWPRRPSSSSGRDGL